MWSLMGNRPCLAKTRRTAGGRACAGGMWVVAVVTSALLLALDASSAPLNDTAIVKVETFSSPGITDVFFSKVTLHDGTVGIGQSGKAWHQTMEETQWVEGTFHDVIVPSALGADALHLAAIEQAAWEQYYKNSGEVFFRALAALDLAVWDAMGKRANISVCNLIRRQLNISGDCPATFPVYGSSMSRTVKPDDLAAKLRALQRDHGVGAFKVKIAQRMGHNNDVYPNRTEEVVAACRASVGADTALMVDANSGYTDVAHAGPVAEMLARYNVRWFEEPCVWNDLQCNRDMVRLGKVKIALGEQEYRLYEDWRMMLNVNGAGYRGGPATDVVQPDVGYGGGLTHVLQVVRWAQDAGLRFVPHSPGDSLTVLATLHLMAALPADFAEPWMEFGCVDGGIPKGTFEPPFDLRDGSLTVPSAPGFGVEIPHSLLAKSRRRVSALPPE